MTPITRAKRGNIKSAQLVADLYRERDGRLLSLASAIRQAIADGWSWRELASVAGVSTGALQATVNRAEAIEIEYSDAHAESHGYDWQAEDELGE